MNLEFVNMKDAEKILGLSKSTLRNYEKEGKIETIRTNTGWRKFNVKKYLLDNNINVYEATINDLPYYLSALGRRALLRACFSTTTSPAIVAVFVLLMKLDFCVWRTGAPANVPPATSVLPKLLSVIRTLSSYLTQ